MRHKLCTQEKLEKRVVMHGQHFIPTGVWKEAPSMSLVILGVAVRPE